MPYARSWASSCQPPAPPPPAPPPGAGPACAALAGKPKDDGAALGDRNRNHLRRRGARGRGPGGRRDGVGPATGRGVPALWPLAPAVRPVRAVPSAAAPATTTTAARTRESPGSSVRAIAAAARDRTAPGVTAGSEVRAAATRADPPVVRAVPAAPAGRVAPAVPVVVRVTAAAAVVAAAATRASAAATAATERPTTRASPGPGGSRVRGPLVTSIVKVTDGGLIVYAYSTATATPGPKWASTSRTGAAVGPSPTERDRGVDRADPASRAHGGPAARRRTPRSRRR